MSQREPISSAELAAYLEGEVAADRVTEIEAQVATCTTSAARLHNLALIKEAIQAQDPLTADMNLVDAVGQHLDQMGDAPSNVVRPARWRQLSWGAGLLAAAAMLVLVPWSFRSTEDGFQARSNSTTAADRWVAVHPFVVEAGEVRPLKNPLRSSTAVALTYTNAGEEPFRYVMVFAVDAGKQVYWFYPAFSDAGSNPTAVAIQGPVTRMELKEMVRHAFRPGPLHLYGLFLREPLTVSQVETMISRAVVQEDGSLGRLPIKESGQHILAFTVEE